MPHQCRLEIEQQWTNDLRGVEHGQEMVLELAAYKYADHAVPGARVELLSDVGHSPMLEDPPRTAALLLAFTAIHAAQAD
jgi:pimeloyl-ACP methyl ester carboxylesterase